jgi:hypothetical protein
MSMWWLLVAFILGAYAGAILVGVMSMAARTDEDNVERADARKRRGEYARRRSHGGPAKATS